MLDRGISESPHVGTRLGLPPASLEINPSMSVRRIGFTVAELIVAIGFLAVISVVVIGLFVRLTASSSKSADQTAALEVASRLLDEYARAAPEEWMNVSSQQDLHTRDPGSKTTYYYRLRHRQIDDGQSLMGDLYRLDVDVFWWPADPSRLDRTPSRRDYGKLKVSLARTVFVERFRDQ